MAQEKGKNLEHLESQLTLKNHNPGCMWGILHHFQHNAWKRIPRKRLISYGRHSSTDQGRNKTKSSSITTSTTTPPPDDNKVQENVDSCSLESPPVETKVVVPSSSSSSGHKSTMKSRIRALIPNKGRHSRSSSYPNRKSLDGGATQLLNEDKTGSPTSSNHNNNNNNNNDSSSSSSPHAHAHDHSSVPKTTSEETSRVSCEMCETILKVNYLKQNELGKQPVRDHTLLHGNSIYAVEPSKCDAIQESKLFMDALDLLNVREEVFMKILQDPTSSLANNQLQFRQPPNLRLGLNKSISFAVTPKKDFSSSSEQKEKEECCVDDDHKGKEEEKDDNKAKNEVEDVQVKKNADSKTGITGFKNIGAKIRHAIRDKKKEKNRIIKDAVQDKIPCDRSVSKNDAQMGTDFGQSSKKSFKRTSSFSDSFDRYNQLLEISINRDAKDHVSDRLRFKKSEANTEALVRKNPAKLGRIFSLPDLRSYSSTQIDDSATNIPPLATAHKAVINEHKSVGGLDSNVESQDNLLDVGEAFNDLVILEKSENDLSGVLNLENVIPLVAASDTTVINEQEPVGLDSNTEGQENLLDVGEGTDELVILRKTKSDSSHVLNLENEFPLVASETVVINEQKPAGLDSYGELQENLLDIGEDFDELVILKKPESESSHVLNLEHVLVSAPPQSQDLGDVSEESDEFVHEIEVCEDSNSSIIQQDTSCSEQDMIDIDTQESEIQQFYNDLMYTHKVDEKNLAEYNYVRDVLELSGFSRDAFLGKWQSAEHLLNPSVFEQVEGCLVDQSGEYEQMYTNSDHALLFDMINEVLLGIHERSFYYWPRSLTSLSSRHRLPKGNRILEEVWSEIRWLLSWRPEADQAIDEAVSRDMGKGDGWMNLQLDAECVGLKLEEMVFDDLVDEIISD